MEIWKDVIGYECLYEVSTEGRVRSVNRKDCRGNRIAGRVMKPRAINSGYLMIHLRDKSGKRKGVLVHRIVAEAFLPRETWKTQVDHINENKHDNAVSNLRWTTPKENTNNGTGIARAAIGRSRGVLMLSESGEVLKAYTSATVAARELGIQQGSITNCCRGKHRHAGGMRWVYST